MMHHAFSRRQFLKAGGAAALSTAAAGLLSSCGGSSAGGTAAASDSATYTVMYARQPAPEEDTEAVQALVEWREDAPYG